MNSDQVDDVALNSVNESIAALQNLSIGLGIIFLNEAAEQRIGLQELDFIDQLLPKATGGNRRVAGNEIQDRFKVFEGLVGPDQPSHFCNRCLADS